jgi:hypothetical protein
MNCGGAFLLHCKQLFVAIRAKSSATYYPGILKRLWNVPGSLAGYA